MSGSVEQRLRGSTQDVLSRFFSLWQDAAMHYGYALCDGCGDWTEDHSTTEGRGSRTFCCECLDRNAWWDDVEECYWNNRFHDPCYTEDTGEAMRCDDAYYCESDGCYYRYEDNMPCDEESSADGYHSNRRRSVTVPYSLGIELEVECHDHGTRYNVSEYAKDIGLLAEEDGSLEDTGIELITNGAHLNLDGVREMWDRILPKIPTQSGVSGYGLHVNICTKGWSELHEALFVAFWSVNEDMVRHVAGRDYYSYCKVARDKKLWSISQEAKDEKYLACNNRIDGRAEVRIFRGTRLPSLFYGRIELTLGVAKWINDKILPKCAKVDSMFDLCDLLTDINNTRQGLYRYLLDDKKYGNASRLVKSWLDKSKDGEKCA